MNENIVNNSIYKAIINLMNKSKHFSSKILNCQRTTMWSKNCNKELLYSKQDYRNNSNKKLNELQKNIKTLQELRKMNF